MDLSSPVTGADVEQDPNEMRRKMVSPRSVMRLVFSAFWVVLFAYTGWASRDFSANSGVFPGVISLIGLVIAIGVLASAVKGALRQRAAVPTPGRHSPGDAASETPGPTRSAEPDLELADAHEDEPSFMLSARYGAWLLGLVLAIWLVGAVIAGGLFVAAFLAFEARANWKWLIAGPVLVTVGLVVLANAINLYWPTTLLGSLLGS